MKTCRLMLSVNTDEVQPGTRAAAEITCEPASFQYTIDGSLLYKNMDGVDVFYMVVQQDGP